MSNEEVELDADHLFKIVLNDPVFQGQMKLLDHQRVANAVVETINMLMSTTELVHERPFNNLSPQGCLVMCVLQQWFVRYFSKKLMQLMTTEALILYRNQIPSTYLVNYLSYQNHFSLKDLVNRCYNALEVMNWYVTKINLVDITSRWCIAY